MKEKHKSIICRICLRADPKLRRKCISLFDKHNETLISENINLIANVKIQEGDGLPSKICPDCLLELDAALNFKTKCETSNVLLQTTLLYTKIPIKSESTKIELVIKKEEPDETEEYLEAEFLIDDAECLDEGSKELATTGLEVEIKPEEIEEEVGAIDLTQKPSRAIDLKLECNECRGLFKSKCKLRVHWKKVHMYESLICKSCMRRFRSYRAYNRHMKHRSLACISASQFHIEGMGKSRVFSCKKCPYSSKRIKDIESHRVTHTGDKPYVCDLCSRGFSQLSSLQGHQEVAHQMYRAESTCHYCGKHLKGRSKIYKHMKQHKVDYVQCDICKKMFKSKGTLVMHLQRHTGVKSYTCEICAQSFYVLAELCTHRRNVHEKGKHIYKCNLCEYQATNAPKIKKHKAGHTKTNIPCLVCGIFVEDAKKLQEHQRRHFGPRNYGCAFCDKKFLDRKTRSKHTQKVHNTAYLMNNHIKNEQAESPTVFCEKNNSDVLIEVEIYPESMN